MGIDFTGLEAIIHSLKFIKNKNNLLTLGRQCIHIHQNIFNFVLEKNNLYNLTIKNNFMGGGYCENFFRNLGFENIDSIDNSLYEGASIIHNMNDPITNFKKYDYIFDGGTIEHIFNIPQVCENIINLLNIDGIFISITPNNNMSGHGMYQFSPEFYLSTFSKKYGMEVQSMYLAKTDSGIEDWIDVNSYNTGRNNSKFDGNQQVYIISIIKKISDERENLIKNAPNQYSYESIDWKRI
jgi:hypothetical protein